MKVVFSAGLLVGANTKFYYKCRMPCALKLT